MVSPVRFERTLPPASGACLLPLGYEDVEPSSGADPDRLPYGGKVTAVCDGEAPAHGLEPRTSRIRPWCSAN